MMSFISFLEEIYIFVSNIFIITFLRLFSLNFLNYNTSIYIEISSNNIAIADTGFPPLFSLILKLSHVPYLCKLEMALLTLGR